MRIPLSLRVARACAAATLIFSLSLTPSFARMGGSGGRPASGSGHFSHFTPRGFNRGFAFNRFGFNRFSPNRFNRFGFNRFNRFGFNRFGGDQLLIGGGWGGEGWGGWGWGDWGGASISGPIIVGDGAPGINNVGADPGRDDAGPGYAGRCVIHKLIYDRDGKFVGERQSPQC